MQVWLVHPLRRNSGGKSIFQLQQQQPQQVRQPGQTHFHSQSLSTMFAPGSGSSSSSANVGAIGASNPTTPLSTPSKPPANPTTPCRKNGQPLPLSKPPSQHPAPDPPIGLLSSVPSSSTPLPQAHNNNHGPSRLMLPVPPVPLGLAVGDISPGRPLPNAAPPNSVQESTDAGSSNVNALPPQAKGLLSPTTGTWKSPITPNSPFPRIGPRFGKEEG